MVYSAIVFGNDLEMLTMPVIIRMDAYFILIIVEIFEMKLSLSIMYFIILISLVAI